MLFTLDSQNYLTTPLTIYKKNNVLSVCCSFFLQKEH